MPECVGPPCPIVSNRQPEELFGSARHYLTLRTSLPSFGS